MIPLTCGSLCKVWTICEAKLILFPLVWRDGEGSLSPSPGAMDMYSDESESDVDSFLCGVTVIEICCTRARGVEDTLFC